MLCCGGCYRGFDMTGPHIVTMFLMVKNDMRRFSIIYLTFLSAFSLCTDPFSPLFLLACCAFTCHMFPLVCCALTQDVTSYFINLLVCQLCAVFLFFLLRERERESIRVRLDLCWNTACGCLYGKHPESDCHNTGRFVCM